jgi:hypothetical protein
MRSATLEGLLRTAFVPDKSHVGWFFTRRTPKRVTVRCPFTDGIVLDVYEDAEGRQYVLEPDGEKCY